MIHTFEAPELLVEIIIIYCTEKKILLSTDSITSIINSSGPTTQRLRRYIDDDKIVFAAAHGVEQQSDYESSDKSPLRSVFFIHLKYNICVKDSYIEYTYIYVYICMRDYAIGPR